MCAEKSVALELAFQKRLGAALFGGDGFILQKVTGPGTVWLDLSGEVVEKELGQGDTLLVHVGRVGIQTSGVQFDIRMMRGFRNILFGGDGLFLAYLSGPGKVWLQSMPIMNLAEEMGRHLPANQGESGSTGVGSAIGGAAAGGAGAVIGGLLGGLLGGDKK